MSQLVLIIPTVGPLAGWAKPVMGVQTSGDQRIWSVRQ